MNALKHTAAPDTETELPTTNQHEEGRCRTTARSSSSDKRGYVLAMELVIFRSRDCRGEETERNAGEQRGREGV